jgi:hypothetical protein
MALAAGEGVCAEACVKPAVANAASDHLEISNQLETGRAERSKASSKTRPPCASGTPMKTRADQNPHAGQPIPDFSMA